MFRIFLFMIVLMVSSPTLGAPIWIERSFVPDAELLDPSFENHDPASVEKIDHSAWDKFLQAYVAESADGVHRVDYASVTEKDSDALDDYIAILSTTDVASLNRNEQLAFWINLYNAATVALVLDIYPVKSIQKIDKPWDQPVVSIDGRTLTLNDIEHRIVRPVFDDHRTHYAFNCAAIGCPNLARAAYLGDNLEKMLNEAARAYVNHPRGVTVKGRKIIASKIYGWYRDDFGGGEQAVLDHIRQFASPALKSSLEGADDIDKYVYDWSLNDAQ